MLNRADNRIEKYSSLMQIKWLTENKLKKESRPDRS